jgi:hypothetical protein
MLANIIARHDSLKGVAPCLFRVARAWLRLGHAGIHNRFANAAATTRYE